jgi:hypothetical protein
MSKAELLNKCIDWIIQHGLANHPEELSTVFEHVLQETQEKSRQSDLQKHENPLLLDRRIPFALVIEEIHDLDGEEESDVDSSAEEPFFMSLDADDDDDDDEEDDEMIQRGDDNNGILPVSTTSNEDSSSMFDENVVMEDANSNVVVINTMPLINRVLKKRSREEREENDEDDNEATDELEDNPSLIRKKQHTNFEETGIFQVIHDVLLEFVDTCPEFLLVVSLLLKLSRGIRKVINGSTFKRYLVPLPMETPRMIITGIIKSRNTTLLREWEFLFGKLQSDHREPGSYGDSYIPGLVGYENPSGNDPHFEKDVMTLAHPTPDNKMTPSDSSYILDGRLARMLDDHDWEGFKRTVATLDSFSRMRLFKQPPSNFQIHLIRRWQAVTYQTGYRNRLMIIQSVLHAIARNDLEYITSLFQYLLTFNLTAESGVVETQFSSTDTGWLIVSLGEMLLLSPTKEMLELILLYGRSLPLERNGWGIYQVADPQSMVRYSTLVVDPLERIGDFPYLRRVLNNPMLFDILERIVAEKRPNPLAPLRFAFFGYAGFAALAREAPSYDIIARIYRQFDNCIPGIASAIVFDKEGKESLLYGFLSNASLAVSELNRAFKEDIVGGDSLISKRQLVTPYLSKELNVLGASGLPSVCNSLFLQAPDPYCIVQQPDHVYVLSENGLAPHAPPLLIAAFLYMIHRKRHTETTLGLQVAERLNLRYEGVSDFYRQLFIADQSGHLNDALGQVSLRLGDLQQRKSLEPLPL